MRDDHVRHETRDLRDRLLAVLVDVGDHVRRREPPQLLHGDILGPADLRDAPQPLPRMDAEASPAHELVAEAEVADELGDARHERNDPDVAFGRALDGPDGVDQRRGSYSDGRRAFLGARAPSASYSRFGSLRRTKPTIAICHGTTANDRRASITRAMRRAASSAVRRNGIRYGFARVIGVSM